MILPLQITAQDTLYAAVLAKIERKRFNLNFFSTLPSAAYERALPLIEDVSKKSFKLLHDQGVILKYDEVKLSQNRHQNNLSVLKFTIENRLAHIIVPRTRLHGNVVIDELIPVKERHYIENFGFYLEHASAFDQAIEEFFRLLCCIRIYDIRGNNKIPYGTLVMHEHYGRYDNVCLYIEDGVGKIGLVDLEIISHTPVKDAKSLAFIMRDLICLFLLHFEQIMKLGLKKNPVIQGYGNYFSKLKIEQDEYIKKVYFDHKAWQESKGIIKAPSREINIPDPSSIKVMVREYLYGEGVVTGEFSIGELDAFFEKDFESLFDTLINWLNDRLKKVEAASPPESVARRTIVGNKKQGTSENTKIDLSLITDAVFFALQDADLIYDYRPKFGVLGHARPTIFC